MRNKINIGDYVIGNDKPCFIIAEIGINHNGDIDLAKKLISAAVLAGCHAVKFQKRTIEVVYSKEELDKPRESPFGKLNLDLKKGLEFEQEQYSSINEYCESHNIIWFGSAWDEKSADFLEKFDPPCYKISSATLTDDNLLKHHLQFNKPLIISTGMSTIEQIDHAVEILNSDNLIIMHCTSTYPAKLEELNLSVIKTLKERYKVPVGYSGHEIGLATTLAAVVLGADIVERHITLDRSMWGSDQAASIEPHGFSRLVRDIKAYETALGDGIKKIYESEIPIIEKLRRVK